MNLIRNYNHLTLNPNSPLAKQIFHVPDKWWGFDAPGRHSHPGLCCGESHTCSKAIMLKGGSTMVPAHMRKTSWSIIPNDHNGLTKTTTFRLEPRRISTRRVHLLTKDRTIGHISSDQLKEVHRELVRVFTPTQCEVEHQ
jgi:hypothetical protein